MYEEPKCQFHGLSRESTCNWCGEIICIQCIEAAYHKKYCPRCYSTLSKNSVASVLDQKRTSRPKGKVLNQDFLLTEEEVKKRKQMLDIEDKAKKILGERRKF